MSSPTSAVNVFPTEIWKEILFRPVLDGEDLSRISQVCKLFSTLMTNESSSPVWERETKYRFSQREAEYKYRPDINWRTLFISYGTKEREKKDVIKKFDDYAKNKMVFNISELKNICCSVAKILIDKFKPPMEQQAFEQKSKTIYLLLKFLENEHCDAEVLYCLGRFVAQGIGTVKDVAEAIEYIRQSADKGNAEAQLDLAIRYELGNGTVKNLEEAVKYYKLSADQGNASAQLNLGQCYEFGKGIGKDSTAAFKCYEKSADQGNASAQYCLGNYYRRGGIGIDKNPEEAFKYHKMAADQGFAPSQYNIGAYYHDGTGTDINLKEAVKYFKLSADQGDANAQANLAICYELGKGTDKNLKEAVKYYKLSADRGNAIAQWRLAFCYAKGKGIGVNLDEANKYCKLSADQGYAEAQFRYACQLKGSNSPALLEIAFGYMKLAANQGYEPALKGIADFCRKGIGTAIDLAQAAEYELVAARIARKNQSKRKFEEISNPKK